MDVEGTVALVTGAASGLGAATARLLADRGATVIGIDREAQPESPHSRVRVVAGDVTSEADVQAALSSIRETGLPLRVAVNCAGIGPSRRILSGQGVHDLESFRRVVDVNLVGTFNVLRLAAAEMAQNEQDVDGQCGVIVNTASIAAFEGQIGQVAYAASKAGIVGMTIAAARDLARNGIRVNTIAPGIVNTPLLASFGAEVNASLAATVPFPGRLGSPNEFASLVLSIIGLDYLNGETIRIDGALRMAPK